MFYVQCYTDALQNSFFCLRKNDKEYKPIPDKITERGLEWRRERERERDLEEGTNLPGILSSDKPF